MPHTVPLAVMFALTTTIATASEFCTIDDTAMFTCTFNGGAKAVEVCDAIWLNGDQAAYGFYNVGGAVEKEIITDKASLVYSDGTGMGNMLGESVTFSTDDGYAYEVFWAAMRDDEEFSGGINVLQNGEQIATLTCDAGSVEQGLYTLIEMIDNAQLSP